MLEGTNRKGDKSAYTYNGLGLRVNNTHTTHAGKIYTRDYVTDYTSFENDDLMVFAEGNGQLEYEQKHVYAGSERIEQFTDKGNWERTLYVHEDVMGNTRYYTKANGQSFAELTYDAWGMPESPNKLLNNDHGNYVFATFTGHIYDTTLDITLLRRGSTMRTTVPGLRLIRSKMAGTGISTATAIRRLTMIRPDWRDSPISADAWM